MDDGKEEMEFELDQDIYDALMTIANCKGITFDQLVEDILQEEIVKNGQAKV